MFFFEMLFFLRLVNLANSESFLCSFHVASQWKSILLSVENFKATGSALKRKPPGRRPRSVRTFGWWNTLLIRLWWVEATTWRMSLKKKNKWIKTVTLCLNSLTELKPIRYSIFSSLAELALSSFHLFCTNRRGTERQILWQWWRIENCLYW